MRRKRPRRWGAREIRRRIQKASAEAWRRGASRVRRLNGKWRRKIAISALTEADVLLASPRTIRLSPISLMHRLVLGARYVHSMLYVGDGRILHTTTRDGVTLDPVPRRVYAPRRYSLYRVPHLTGSQRRGIVAAALRQRHKRLDRAALVTNVPAKLLGLKKPLFRFERNRLWCSKLIYEAYAEAGIDLLPHNERGNVTSEDLAKSGVLERIELGV